MRHIRVCKRVIFNFLHNMDFVFISMEDENMCTKKVQGQTGRVFQLRVGSGSGIEKIYRVGLGIGYLYQIPSQLGIMGY